MVIVSNIAALRRGRLLVKKASVTIFSVAEMDYLLNALRENQAAVSATVAQTED